MEVKVVQLYGPHVMEVLSFPTLERTTANDSERDGSAQSSRKNVLKAIARHSGAFDHYNTLLHRGKCCNSSHR